MLLKEATFTIFDFETTGLYAYSSDKICEIGAIRIGPAKKDKQTFHSMVNPERPISRGAFLVNGITEDMLIGAPTIYGILPQFIKFIKGSVLVAYNAGFDIAFLECALGEEKDILDDYHIIDALRLARQLFPGLRRYNLANVASSLGICSLREHRAIFDVTMTLEIFQKELELLISARAETVEDIARTRPKKAAPINMVKDYKIELIRKAIRDQKRLNIAYLSSWKNEMTRRTITPMEIQEGYESPYVVAYCHLRKEKRNFRLDGIIKAELTGEKDD